MFNTNDIYNDAARGSRIHTQEEESARDYSFFSKVTTTLLLTGVAYVGFNLYSSTNLMDTTSLIKNKLLAEIQRESEPIIIAMPSVSYDNSEEEYLQALRGIESELTEKEPIAKVDIASLMDLSSAMSDVLNYDSLPYSTQYTSELNKEIGIEESKSEAKVTERKVTVKKGDTLQSISNKFYGDARNYKRIIASNASLKGKNTTIYVGQTINLPY